MLRDLFFGLGFTYGGQFGAFSLMVGDQELERIMKELGLQEEDMYDMVFKEKFCSSHRGSLDGDCSWS